MNSNNLKKVVVTVLCSCFLVSGIISHHTIKQDNRPNQTLACDLPDKWACDLPDKWYL